MLIPSYSEQRWSNIKLCIKFIKSFAKHLSYLNKYMGITSYRVYKFTTGSIISKIGGCQLKSSEHFYSISKKMRQIWSGDKNLIGKIFTVKSDV